MTQYDRELEQIERDHASGFISREEMNQQLRDLDRDYRNQARWAAEEAARDAYERELERW